MGKGGLKFSKREISLITALGFALAALGGTLFSRFVGKFEWEAVTAFIAIVGLAFAVVGYFDNRKAQRLEHRAYIEMTFGEVYMDEANRLWISTTIRNYGRTPGEVHFRYQGSLFENRAKLPNEMVISGGFSIDMLHPGVPREDKCPVFQEIKNELFSAIYQGKACVNLNGQILYTDVFGDTHFELISHGKAPVALDPNVILY